MHVKDIFAAVWIREKIVLANIAKIKRSRIKDGLQNQYQAKESRN